MQPKPYILKLALFLSLPFMVISAIVMIAGYLIVTFCGATVTAYFLIRDLYGCAPKTPKTEARAA